MCSRRRVGELCDLDCGLGLLLEPGLPLANPITQAVVEDIGSSFVPPWFPWRAACPGVFKFRALCWPSSLKKWKLNEKRSPATHRSIRWTGSPQEMLRIASGRRTNGAIGGVPDLVEACGWVSIPPAGVAIQRARHDRQLAEDVLQAYGEPGSIGSRLRARNICNAGYGW